MINAVIGGTLIGLSAVWLMASLGRIAGISGIIANTVTQPKSSLWAIFFIIGMGIGSLLASTFIATHTATEYEFSGYLIIGGLVVGVGTRMGSGCTSGHGVCGIARLSPRSIIATITFLSIGMLTATLLHFLISSGGV